MANGNPADVGYNSQGVPESLISGLINRKARGAEGLNALNQSSLFPALQQTIQRVSEEQRKKQLIQKLAMAMQNYSQPQQGPQNAAGPAIQGPQGYVPPGAGPSAVPVGQFPMEQNPQSGMGAPTGQNSGEIMSLLMQSNPEIAQKVIAERMMGPNPLQQSEIVRNLAQAGRYGQMGQNAKPSGTVFRNSATGEMTDDPVVATGPEWKAYKTTQGDVLNKLAGQTAGRERNKAAGARAEAWQRSIDVHQIDKVTQMVGLTPKQQSSLQMNNQRAARANEILAQPKITWQELALGEIDLTGIMQGGVPVRDEIAATHFPGWQQEWAKWRTYATGHPTENVPPEIQAKVKGLINGVIAIDNRFLTANATFAKKMIGPTIRGGLGKMTPAIDEMTGALTSAGQDKGGFSDQGKEARYQAWKKANGY